MKRYVLKAVGSIIELFPTNPNEKYVSSIPTHSDEEAIRKDWEQVGKDMWYAFQKNSNQ